MQKRLARSEYIPLVGRPENVDEINVLSYAMCATMRVAFVDFESPFRPDCSQTVLCCFNSKFQNLAQLYLLAWLHDHVADLKCHVGVPDI